MKLPFDIHDRVVLRSPLFSLNMPENEEELFAFFDQPLVREALYLASPNLLREFEKWQKGEITKGKELNKLRDALMKYYQRMHSRCTPFGLFAGVGVIGWDNEAGPIEKPNAIGRHTRLDMSFLCQLAAKVVDMLPVKSHLKYYPNTSVYHLQDKIRYIEYVYKGKGNKAYQLASLANTEAITYILDLARSGQSIDQLASVLVDEDISLEDAREFINALVDIQLLVSELEFSVTGPEYFYLVEEKLVEIQARNPHPELRQLIKQLKALNDQLKLLNGSEANQVETYKAITEMARAFISDIDENRLFQVDMNYDFSKGALPFRVKRNLRNVVRVCSRLSENHSNYRLREFKNKFLRRYEDQEMPLIEVLDVESGIGYGDMLLKDDNELTRDLFMNNGDDKDEIDWHKLNAWKTKKLIECVTTHQKECVLTDEDVNQFEESLDDIPPSFSVIFRTYGNDDLFIEQVGGTSAANLLGRFAHTNSEVNDLIQDVTRHEQKMDEGVIFAEIAHLPENRVGNILLRPVFRDYEIPFLAHSTMPEVLQIPVQDLYVSVVWNRIYLRSKRLGLIIHPRLSTAHNYVYNSQPIYQFLCDLQQQGIQTHMNFNWGPLLRHFKYLPRVRYRNLILFRAFWQLNRDDFRKVIKAEPQKQLEEFALFHKHFEIPRYFVLADMDNEMLVDAENPLSVQCFINTIKKRSQIVLKEFPLDENRTVRDENGVFCANQFVATVIKTKATYDKPLPNHLRTEYPVVKQPLLKHSLDSDWAYYKIYCGTKTSDRVLLEVIRPMVQQFVKDGWIKQWFFLRFKEQDEHFRIRFKVSAKEYFAPLHQELFSRLKPFEQSGQVWKVLMDTYIPEKNRYGQTTLKLSEQLFYQESHYMLDFLHLVDQSNNPSNRWHYGLRYIDQMLSAFKCTLEEKNKILEVLKSGFEQEFRVSASMRKRILQKYKAAQEKIEEVLSPEHQNMFTERMDQHFEDIAELCRPINDFNTKMALMVDFENLLSSYLHMFINRLIPSFQRKNELLLYCFLNHYYRGKVAKQKQLNLKTVRSHG